MSFGDYAVISGIAHKIIQQYAVVSGTARRITKKYAVVNGVTKRIFASTQEVVYTASTVVTVPSGVKTIDIFCVGGGGGGGGAYWYNVPANGFSMFHHGSAGGGGYTANQYGIPVSAGDTLAVTVGAGGIGGYGYWNEIYGTFPHNTDSASGVTNGSAGSYSAVTKNGVQLIRANGGNGGNKGVNNTNSYYTNGANGGSGSRVAGGDSTMVNSYWYQATARNHGSDGSDGQKALSNVTSDYIGTPGTGQGTTTKAFEVGTRYSDIADNNSSANTGQGGGELGFDGGSGVVIIRYNY